MENLRDPSMRIIIKPLPPGTRISRQLQFGRRCVEVDVASLPESPLNRFSRMMLVLHNQAAFGTSFSISPNLILACNYPSTVYRIRTRWISPLQAA